MDVPVVAGELDRGYVAAALARAGRPALTGALSIHELAGGRSGATVASLRSGGTRWVHKAIPRASARSEAIGDQGGTEVNLWAAGVTRELPAPLSCPTIDATLHEARDEWWLLMDDVSDGIVPRSQFVKARARELLTAVARLHARYWGCADDLPAPAQETWANVVCPVNGVVARGETPTGFAKRWCEGFFVLPQCMPRFMELLDPSQATFYIRLCAEPASWLAALARHPTTLVHGDLRRANISFQDGRVTLFDWDLAARAHAAVDLQWWWLLQFWAYPPSDGQTIDDREGLRQHYLGALEAELGPIDRAGFEVAWELAWLKNLAQLGYVIADPLTDADADPDARARAQATARRAIDWARRICDDHV